VDPTAPLFIWVLILSALSVCALLVVVAAAFAWFDRQALRQAREWGRHMIMAQENERGRIARDLHDDIIQRLWLVRLTTQNGQAAEAGGELEAIMGDLRTIAHELHPPALSNLNLGEALRDLAARHFSSELPTISIEIRGDAELESAKAIALYRVAQEAFTNITKHSGATHVRLTLSKLPGQVRLEVEDNGIGLVPTRSGGSFGLRGIHERMEMLGGQASVATHPGGGTMVRATVPLS
jgi:signal transduction histidine kinase